MKPASPLADLTDAFHTELDAGQQSALISWLAFTTTFAAVRGITYSIRAGKGPFGNLSVGGEHLHHYMWGIGLLAGVGGVAVHGEEKHRRHPLAAVTYGSGLALIVDEFALLLDLKDVYWAKQGRVSVDVGIGAISATASYFAALPVLRRMRKARTGRSLLAMVIWMGGLGQRWGLRQCGGDFFGYPLDLGQPRQGRPRQDPSYVAQCHHELLDSVQGRLVARVKQDRLVVLGRDDRAGQFDGLGTGQEQRRDGGFQDQCEGGHLGRGERPAAAFGLVNGLAAPRLIQVFAHGLAQLGERQLPRLTQPRDLLANGRLDAHVTSQRHSMQ
jgi:hypothetical protein